MDNVDHDRLTDWEDLALSHAGEKLRAPLRDALLFDRRLSRITLMANEPALGQLKLAWWREELGKISSGADTKAPDPLLSALALSWGKACETLDQLIDGWEALLPGDEDDPGEIAPLVAGRAYVFARLAAISGHDAAGSAAAMHGAAWAYAELAQILGKEDRRAMDQGLEAASSLPLLPRDLRALAVIGGLSRRSLMRGGKPIFGDRLSPFAALRLGILGS